MNLRTVSSFQGVERRDDRVVAGCHPRTVGVGRRVLRSGPSFHYRYYRRQLHTLECDAESLFAAADRAVSEWNRLWWYSSDAVLEVRSGDEQWRVNQARVRERRKGSP